MSKVCQSLQQTTRSIYTKRSDVQEYTRVNSPGLPNSSFRFSCRRDKKKIEIGLVTEKKLSESPKLRRLLSTGDLRVHQSTNSFTEQEVPYPQSNLPKMEPPQKRNMLIEKLESDKLYVEIFMSEEDDNLMFTGISKMKPDQNKQAILENLHQLFQHGINGQNQYIKLESLEKNLNLSNQSYFGITNKKYSSLSKRQQTFSNRSLSISTIKEQKSVSSKMSKDIEQIQQGIQRFKQKTKQRPKQPLSQCNNTLKPKPSSKSPFLKNPVSSVSTSKGKVVQKSKNKPINSTKSMHI